jgi:hypothetical protein
MKMIKLGKAPLIKKIKKKKNDQKVLVKNCTTKQPKDVTTQQ